MSSDEQRFSVGEIAIYVRPDSESYGAEVRIASPLKPMRMSNYEGTAHRDALAHEIEVGNLPAPPTGKWAAEPRHLRKRPPKQDWKSLCNLTDLPREVSHV